jgi:hypothetical protein
LEGGSRRPQFKAILGYTVRPYCEGVKKKKNLYWSRWFTPVILATQEAEIRRISVQSQP